MNILGNFVVLYRINKKKKVEVLGHKKVSIFL